MMLLTSLLLTPLHLASTLTPDDPTAADSALDEARAVDSGSAGQDEFWNELRERLRVSGDIRLRFEGNYKRDGQDDRNRARARFRLGGALRIDEEFLVGGRVSTGDPDDPNSPHVDFGGGLDRSDFNLDRWYVEYTPNWSEGLTATAGKFAHPFYSNPVFGEYVWDADIQPEGLALQHGWSDVGFLDGVDLALGEYVLVEQNLADEASAFVVQLTAKKDFGQDTDARLALGWYHYSNLTPDGNTTLVDDNQGNAVSGGEFESEFSVLNPILGITSNRWSQPLTLALEYMHNFEAEVSGDTGYAAGVGIGRKKQKGDWYGYYGYSMIEQDAVFSPFVNDDFLLAANTEGHVAGVKYRVLDNVELHLWSLISARDELGTTETTDSDRHQWRVRLDLNVSF